MAEITLTHEEPRPAGGGMSGLGAVYGAVTGLGRVRILRRPSIEA